MTLIPHPAIANVTRYMKTPIDDGHKITLSWHTWFERLKDQVNLGEIPAAVQEISAADGIFLPAKVTNIIIRIISATSGVVDITKNPQIEAGFDGQVITLEGQNDTRGVKLDNGDGLALGGGTSITLGENDIIRMHYNADRKIWIENNRSLN
jgi:hypothetical protein